jgi:hypothetical protein
MNNWNTISYPDHAHQTSRDNILARASTEIVYLVPCASVWSSGGTINGKFSFLHREGKIGAQITPLQQ